MFKHTKKFIYRFYRTSNNSQQVSDVLSTKKCFGERGSAVTEFLVTLPILLLLGLGTWQGALVYNAKTTLNYATFESARVGAVEHAQSAPIRTELGLRLAPLYGGDGSPEKAFASMVRGSLEAKNPLVTKIEIINPSQEAFNDFGTQIVDPTTKEVKFGIPNGQLRYRPRTVKASSGVNIQDANLLKIKTTYGYQLSVPLMDRVIPAIMKRLDSDPQNKIFYDQGRIPIVSVATVRMQSNAWPDPNNISTNGGASGSGSTAPHAPVFEETLPPTTDGQGGEPEPIPDSSNSDDTDTAFKLCTNGICEDEDDEFDGLNDGNADHCKIPTSTASTLNGSVNLLVGNPINLVTGNKYQSETDLTPLLGQLGLSFTRHYNSQSSHQSTLGYNWRHDFEHQLNYQKKANRYQLTQGDGRTIQFNATEQEGQYQASRFVDGWLQITPQHISWYQRDGHVLRYTPQGKLKSITSSTGKKLTLHYNRQGQLFLIRDPQQRELVLKYYPNGRLKAILDPKGQKTIYRYDNNGNLTTVLYADGTQKHYHYEDSKHPHALTGITDQLGVRYATYRYDDQGRGIESSHIENIGKVTLDFSTPGQTKVTNSLGQTITYTTEIKNGIALITRISGSSCSRCSQGEVIYQYNDQLQLTQKTQQNGTTTHYTYDAQGRTTKITQTSQGQSRDIVAYQYPKNSQKPSVIQRPSVNPDGQHIIKIRYNAQQQPIEVTEHSYRPKVTQNGDIEHYIPISRTTKLTYQNGNLIVLDGPRDDVQDLIQLSYDSKNRLQTLTGLDGRTLNVQSYDLYGRPTQIQHGSQSPIQLSYNEQGLLKSVTQYNQSIQYQYRANGQLSSLTDIDGETLNLNYDEAHRIIGLSVPNGPELKDQLDTEGQLVQRQLFDHNGQLIQNLSYLYDAQGRLNTKQHVQQGETKTQKYQYNASGQLSQLRDPQNNVHQIQYGTFGQLQNLIAADQSQIHLKSDPKGQLAQFIDPQKNNTITLKDDFGNVIYSRHPDSGVQTYLHDAVGNLIQKTDALGNTTTYAYDAANRLIKEDNPDESITLSYDPVTGRLSQVVQADTTETFQYNSEGQLTEHLRQIDQHRFSTQYRYNEQQQLVQKTLPDGKILNYHYYRDDVTQGQQKNKLRAITQQTLFGFKQKTIIGEIDHDKTDGQSGYLHGNGIQTTYHWDSQGKLSQLTHRQTLSLHYRYDSTGNISGIDLNGLPQNYLYDAQGRLISAQSTQEQTTYQYDPLGNRTQKTHIDSNGHRQTQEYSYPETGQGSRLLSVETSGDTQTITYNAAGSPTQIGDLHYQYNVNQRPIKVTRMHNGQETLVAQYRYNRFGQRIQKTVYQNNQPQTTTYLYDGHTLSAEVNAQGKITAQYLYLNGRTPIAKLQDKAIYAIHGDHLGTPHIVTNPQQEIVWQASYSPFGKATLHPNTNSAKNIQLNLRYPGQYYDLETDTHYNHYRTYDPNTGRYLTTDPIGLKGGLNHYSYVTNNPLSKIDPLGLAPLTDDDSSYLAQIVDIAAEKGQDILIGEQFQANATSIVYRLPDAFKSIAGNNPLLQTPSAELQAFFGDGTAMGDMVNVLISIALINKGLDFIIKKPNPLTFFGGIVIKHGLKAGLVIYLASEYGEAAKPLFKQLEDIMEQIIQLEKEELSLCDAAIKHEAISEQLAQALLDFVKEAGIGNLRGLKNTLNLKNKKKDKSCKPPTQKEHEKCYKGKKGFKGISIDKIKKLESVTGKKAQMCPK